MAMIGFIGMGNMGYAFAKGLLTQLDLEDIIFSCLTEEKKKKVSEELGIRAVKNNIELVRACEVIVLAVKPQMYDEIFKEIKNYVIERSIIISLAPGKSIEYISKSLGEKVRVVRAMPNTPALIEHGVTGISYDENIYNEKEIRLINSIFDAVGSYKKVDEKLMSAIVCASGSSPAYVYMFIEELARACEAKGLPYETAKEMAAGTVLGAAMMVLKSNESPETLKNRVCSKGGTTIAGIEKLEENGFKKSIWAATQACYNRSEELGK